MGKREILTPTERKAINDSFNPPAGSLTLADIVDAYCSRSNLLRELDGIYFKPTEERPAARVGEYVMSNLETWQIVLTESESLGLAMVARAGSPISQYARIPDGSLSRYEISDFERGDLICADKGGPPLFDLRFINPSIREISNKATLRDTFGALLRVVQSAMLDQAVEARDANRLAALKDMFLDVERRFEAAYAAGDVPPECGYEFQFGGAKLQYGYYDAADRVILPYLPQDLKWGEFCRRMGKELQKDPKLILDPNKRAKGITPDDRHIADYMEAHRKVLFDGLRSDRSGAGVAAQKKKA